MKKVLAVILVLLLLISFACPVSAQSFSDENEMSAVELSIKRLNARIKGKSKIELADEILSDLGMSERFIKNVPSERKEELALTTNIYKVTEYIRVNKDGKEILISKNEYDNAPKDNDFNNLNRSPATEEWLVEDDGLDSLFIRTLLIYKDDKYVPGKYAIFGVYEYKHMPFWRGTDVLSISGDHLIFERSSFVASAVYTETSNDTGSRVIIEDYDVNTIKKATDIELFLNAIAFKYDLPNNYIYNTPEGSGTVTTYSDLSVSVFVTAVVDDSTTQRRFSVFFNYFHQKVGLGDFCVSVDVEGISVSVSPKLCYEKHQIATPNHIEYNP